MSENALIEYREHASIELGDLPEMLRADAGAADSLAAALSKPGAIANPGFLLEFVRAGRIERRK